MITLIQTSKTYDFHFSNYVEGLAYDDGNIMATLGDGWYEYELLITDTKFLKIDKTLYPLCRLGSLTYRFLYDDGEVKEDYYRLKYYDNLNILHTLDFAGTSEEHDVSFIGKVTSILAFYEGNFEPSLLFQNYYPFTLVLEESSDALIMNFYNLTGEKDIVTKTSYLSAYTTLVGRLTEECDILNPNILIQYDDATSLLSCNYMYIGLFKRYYFINQIVSVRKGIWRINAHVDVLYTYDSDIRKQSGFIDRNENATADDNLIDDRIPYNDTPTIVYKNVTDIGASSQANASFDFTDVASGYRFIFKALNNVTWIFSDTDISSPNTYLPDIPNLAHTTGSLYLVDSSTMSNIVTANSNNDNGASSIISMLYIPVELKGLYGFTSAPTTHIYSGSYILDTDSGVMSWYSTPHSSGYEPVGYHVEQSNSPYLIISDFSVDCEPFDTTTTPYNTFGNSINESGKVHYELYIPFVGYVELPYKDIKNGRLQLMYEIDFDTGMGLAFLYNLQKGKVIYSNQCQIGYQIPINTTNAREIAVQKQNNLTNLMLSLVGSVITIGLGALSGGLASTASTALIAGAGALAGAGKQTTSAIAGYINSNNLLFERSQVNIGGGVGLFYMPVTKPHWKITYHDIIDSDITSYYLHRNGYPLRKYDALTKIIGGITYTYTGYTEISQLHYTPSTQTYITSPEIDEIENLAMNGIIL